MGILNEFYHRVLGAINSLYPTCDHPDKDESGHRCLKRQGEGSVRAMELEKRLEALENMAHPPREFVTCEECNNKIKEK